MRYIDKSAAPRVYNDWLKEMRKDSPQNITYENLPTDKKNAVKIALLEEQGYLCAYTLRRITGVHDCHIEHVLARNSHPQNELDYTNMVACIPANGGDKSLGYGAPIKGGGSIKFQINFISPHSIVCDDSFQYDRRGALTAIGSNPSAAARTIDTLKLNHDSLAQLRRSAFQAHGIGVPFRSARRTHKALTAAAARTLAREVLKLDAAGKFEPFCVALAQLAILHAQHEEARAARLKSKDA
jgi:uncharacterized protein (TIGR02646 family)